MTTTETLPFPATRPDTPTSPTPDTTKAIGKCQRAVAVLSLLRELLKDLWGESSPEQAVLIQRCLQLESEATERLQKVRDLLHQMPALGPDCEGPRAA